jgi:hypothetical protein
MKFLPSLIIPTLLLASGDANAGVILVDVGNTTLTTSGQPEAWNNLTDFALNGTVVGGLVDTTGANTGYNLTVTTSGFIGYAANSANGNQTLTPTSASYDSFFGLADPSVLRLSNLDTSLTYSFTFFGSVFRDDAINRNTAYTVGGQTVSLQTRNNAATWSDTISGISPDVNGNIDITLARGAGNAGSSYLLNILKVESIPEPSHAVLSLAGVSLMALRRRRN